MAKRTLAERLDQAAQRKQKAEQNEARLRLMQRKERSRSLSELGNLAARAGIDHLPAAALYVAFRRIAAEAQDAKAVATWEREGLELMRRPEKSQSVMVARFRSRPEAPVVESLRQLGFRWNRVLGQWEGRVSPEEASTVVKAAGGIVQEVEQAA